MIRKICMKVMLVGVVFFAWCGFGYGVYRTIVNTCAVNVFCVGALFLIAIFVIGLAEIGFEILRE